MMNGRMNCLALICLCVFSGNGVWAQHGDGEGHRQGSAHHDFADAERWASIFEADDRGEWQKPDHVVEIMEIRAGMTVADIGAGTGYFLSFLQAAVGSEGKVLALDPEPELVDYMSKRAEKEGWSQVDARTIPFDDPGIREATADRILIVDTWHHIENRERYSRRLKEALSEGGRVLVVDFTMQSPYGPSTKHRIPAEQVRRELEAGGLHAEVVEENLPYQFVIVASSPSESR